MNPILYDLCKDAIHKLSTADTEGQTLLVHAAANALMLSEKARQEGLLALEKTAAIQPLAPSCLTQIITLIVEGRDPQLVLEVAANIYWTQNPQGVHAMVHYFYIRSMLLVQTGQDPRFTQELFISLLPNGWQENFACQVQQEKKQMELARQKETMETFYSIHPSFQNTMLLQKLPVLETGLLGFSSGTVQKLLQNIRIETLTTCLYAFQEPARNKILQNISRHMRLVLMQDVIWRKDMKETDVLTAVEKVIATIDSLRKRAEIAE